MSKLANRLTSLYFHIINPISSDEFPVESSFNTSTTSFTAIENWTVARTIFKCQRIDRPTLWSYVTTKNKILEMSQIIQWQLKNSRLKNYIVVVLLIYL